METILTIYSGFGFGALCVCAGMFLIILIDNMGGPKGEC